MLMDDILDEGLLEIFELIENTTSLFLQLEKSGTINSSLLEELLRDIHSTKGALGMLGFEKEAEAIHHLESFLDKAIKVDGLTSGVATLLLEIMYKIETSLEGEEFIDLSPYLNCYSCVEKNSFKVVCESHNSRKIFQPSSPLTPYCVEDPAKDQKLLNSNNEESRDLESINRNDKYELILVGFDAELTSLLSEKAKVLSLHCVNELYRMSRKVSCTGFVLLNLKNFPITPFLTINILQKFCPHMCFAVVAESSSQLSKCLDEHGKELPDSFLVLKDIKKDKNRNFLFNLIKSK